MQSTTENEPGNRVWKIRDAKGRVIAEHVRADTAEGKEVRWRQPDGTWGLNGTKIHDLPLYGAHDLEDADPDELVVVAEGEKARDALSGAGILSVATVTGAGSIPSEVVLAVLRGHRVALWPDADEQGREHMNRIGELLAPVTAELLLYDWTQASNKGDDAADHPAIQSRDSKALGKLRTDLESAPRWKPPKPHNRLLDSRILLGDVIMNGTEPPEELEPGVLLKGKVHSIYAPPGAGKTMLMLWLVKRCVHRGEKVLLLDSENGYRIISERLTDMGVDGEKIDEHLVYLDTPSLAIPGQPDYLALLDEVEPALVVFDSLISFLAGSGCEENSATDIAAWAVAFCHPARNRNISVLLLDHVPHEGAHARGSTRKKDEVDVQWSLKQTQPFDRESVGELVMFREKDREAWLPPSVKFSVGGSQDGFIFEKSAGTVVEPRPDGNLTPYAEKTLSFIREKGEKGAAWKELHRALRGSKSTLSTALAELRRANLCIKDESTKHHYATEPEKSIDTAVKGSSVRFGKGSVEHTEPGEQREVRYGTHPLGGVPTEPDAEPTDAECSRRPNNADEQRQAEQLIEKLVADGMEPDLARRELLGEEEV